VTALRRLAAAHGVLTSYYGLNGLARAKPEPLLAILRILGAGVERVEDAEDALRERRRERGRRLLPAVVVSWVDAPPVAPLTHLEGDRGSGRWSLTFEDGSRFEESFDLEALPTIFASRGVVRRRLSLPSLPYGYHRLEVALGERRAEATLLSAPLRSYRSASSPARGWGLFAPLYALHSESSMGVGDFGDLARLSSLVSTHGGNFAATLPFLASFPNEPSPYSPASRLFWNELFVDPRLAPEWDLVRSPVPPMEWKREPLIDYPAVISFKRALVESMSREALRTRPHLFDRLLRNERLVAYARFRSAADARRTPWPSWREPPPEGDLRNPSFLYHLYAQALAEEQIARVAGASEDRGVRFYLDMPLGVHGHGFDTWANPELFAREADVGAPPDALFTDGQGWGFPPVVPERSRAEGHRYFRDCLAHVMRHSGMLRIDHVMGLHRQFWIPAGFEKRDGVYVCYPAEELHAVASLESHRHRTELVGENLGIVPEAVERALARHGWRGISVMQFRLTGNPSAPLTPSPANVVASFNTHDTPTFAGFRRGRDLEDRVQANLLAPEMAQEIAQARRAAIRALDRSLGLDLAPDDADLEALARWLKLLLDSDSDQVAITLEDLWLEEEPQNVPGRMDRPNWRRKLRHALTSLPPETLTLLSSVSRPA
jgi:4-alpha-glucanotransferase